MHVIWKKDACPTKDYNSINFDRVQTINFVLKKLEIHGKNKNSSHLTFGTTPISDIRFLKKGCIFLNFY